MRRESPKLPKKPYRKPQLLVYGDLTEMTRSSGSMKSQLDGAVKGNRKTGV